MKIIYLLAAVVLSLTTVTAQNSFGQIQNTIPRDQNGINQFDVKKDSVAYKGISVDLGAAFALQFQGLKSFNDQSNLPAPITGYRLNNLGNNFNLPTANMIIGAQLYDGVRVNSKLDKWKTTMVMPILEDLTMEIHWPTLLLEITLWMLSLQKWVLNFITTETVL